MTWEDVYKVAKSGCSDNYQTKCLQALSRQVPQTLCRRSENEPLICPICLRVEGLGDERSFTKNNYCGICGQRLDWGKVR